MATKTKLTANAEATPKTKTTKVVTLQDVWNLTAERTALLVMFQHLIIECDTIIRDARFDCAYGDGSPEHYQRLYDDNRKAREKAKREIRRLTKTIDRYYAQQEKAKRS